MRCEVVAANSIATSRSPGPIWLSARRAAWRQQAREIAQIIAGVEVEDSLAQGQRARSRQRRVGIVMILGGEFLRCESKARMAGRVGAAMATRPAVGEMQFDGAAGAARPQRGELGIFSQLNLRQQVLKRRGSKL